MRLQIVNALMAGTLMLVAASACGGRGDVATPRQVAYPRLNLPDSSYHAEKVTPLSFEINDGAVLVADSAGQPEKGRRSRWYNIVYPSLGGSRVYTTFTPVEGQEDAAAVVANRVERMSLNSGGNRSELLEQLTPYGFTARVLVTPVGTLTPVQFVANNDHWVVSGAYFIGEDAVARPDSVRPAVEAVKRDIIHAISRLR